MRSHSVHSPKTVPYPFKCAGGAPRVLRRPAIWIRLASKPFPRNNDISFISTIWAGVNSPRASKTSDSSAGTARGAVGGFTGDANGGFGEIAGLDVGLRFRSAAGVETRALRTVLKGALLRCKRLRGGKG